MISFNNFCKGHTSKNYLYRCFREKGGLSFYKNCLFDKELNFAFLQSFNRRKGSSFLAFSYEQPYRIYDSAVEAEQFYKSTGF
ncbi:hypothetical protein NEOC65_000969 [Neochlamydia sp. AcF65]|nr:hypothetical protein [Neochlamydia sp. AcF65]